MKAGSIVTRKIAQRQKRPTRFRCKMWHVAPAMYRDAIAQVGLRCAPWQDGCRVYLWDSLKAACWFKAYHDQDGDQSDVWEVDVEGLPLIVDDEACDMRQWSTYFEEGESGHGFFTQQAVPVSRLRGPVDLCKVNVVT